MDANELNMNNNEENDELSLPEDNNETKSETKNENEIVEVEELKLHEDVEDHFNIGDSLPDSNETNMENNNYESENEKSKLHEDKDESNSENKNENEQNDDDSLGLPTYDESNSETKNDNEQNDEGDEIQIQNNTFSSKTSEVNMEIIQENENDKAELVEVKEEPKSETKDENEEVSLKPPKNSVESNYESDEDENAIQILEESNES